MSVNHLVILMHMEGDFTLFMGLGIQYRRPCPWQRTYLIEGHCNDLGMGEHLWHIAVVDSYSEYQL